jgi:hypothetical protein
MTDGIFAPSTARIMEEVPLRERLHILFVCVKLVDRHATLYFRFSGAI